MDGVIQWIPQFQKFITNYLTFIFGFMFIFKLSEQIYAKTGFYVFVCLLVPVYLLVFLNKRISPLQFSQAVNSQLFYIYLLSGYVYIQQISNYFIIQRLFELQIQSKLLTMYQKLKIENSVKKGKFLACNESRKNPYRPTVRISTGLFYFSFR